MDEHTREILDGVDNLIRVHDAWVNDPDPRLGQILPQEIEEAANALFALLLGKDIPAQCRILVSSIEAFQVEWDMYSTGHWKAEGQPHDSLYTALRRVIENRATSVELRAKRPEPVSVLLKQNVSMQQIATEIYGHNGKGPFIQNGEILFDLIQKEADKPGSVIPADWIPPYEEARLKRNHDLNAGRLQAIDRKIGPSKPKESVEGLLKEGQYVDVIAQVCNVTEEQVKGIAEVLGLKINYRPNLASERAPSEPQINREAALAIDAGAAVQAGLAASQGKPAKVKISGDVRRHVLELYEAGTGAAEIAQEIGGLTPGQVAQIIRQSNART